jgi:hypothetical protein
VTANLISINKDERLPEVVEVHQRIMMRDPENAICEMGAFITELTSAMNDLGRSYPGIISVCCLTIGQVHSALVLAPSREGMHVSPAAGSAVQHLAAIIASQPDLLATFEATLTTIKANQSGDRSA